MAAYQKSPFEDSTIQDALTLVAVYAAQTDPQDCEKDVKRIGIIHMIEQNAEHISRSQRHKQKRGSPVAMATFPK